MKVEVTVGPEPVREETPLRERLDAFWAAHPLPEPTGKRPDKAFFDDVSGQPD